MKDVDNLQSHIFPFLWVHGEPHDAIKREILAIRSCGITAFCVESRPHPDFCGQKWWDDFDHILRVAKDNGMKVWLLDDKQFPSGYANGAVEEDESLAPLCLRVFYIDFYSEGNRCRFIINDEKSDEIHSVFVFERDGDGIVYESGEDVTEFVRDNVLTLDCKKRGFYRIAAVIKTRRFPEKEKRIDMLNSSATNMQIKNVYEPHYLRYANEFGKTFVGFFSDEPRFFNGTSEPYFNKASRYQIKPGLKGVVYPFSDEVELSLDLTDKKKILGLWDDFDGAEQFRIDYMDSVTDIYRRNFSEKIGDWCKAHGVLYAGHVVEDMGAHRRLGIGAGHFFKAQSGQDFSGVDLVLHQVECGFSHLKHHYACKTLMDDPTFFHFTLAKLAVSAAHLDERKQNRALCEIFGAYGWGETLSQMKWFVDFMLVRGINYFIPHAFNPKVDDDDCPPYFYCGGKNPMFSGFKELMRYTQKTCEKLSISYDVDVAVLYDAEADWGGGEYRSMDEINRELTERQIDFEIVPSHDLYKTKAKLLIVPYATSYGERAEKEISKFGGKVVRQQKNGGISEEALSAVEREYALITPNRDVRVLKRGEDYFIFNEGVEPCDNGLALKGGEILYFSLKAGESVLLNEKNAPYGKYRRVFEIDEKCETYLDGNVDGRLIRVSSRSYTDDINDLPEYSKFTGKVVYLIDFDFKLENNERFYLDFGDFSGGIKVTLNGCEKDELFGVPYRCEVTDCLQNGNNELRVEISTTLALKYRDKFSKYCKIDKCGLNDKIKILAN